MGLESMKNQIAFIVHKLFYRAAPVSHKILKINLLETVLLHKRFNSFKFSATWTINATLESDSRTQ